MAKSAPKSGKAAKPASSHGAGDLLSAAASAPQPTLAPGAGPGLDAILGQPRALASLRKSLSGERLHHAFIFHGPSGVGKFTAACALGRELLDPGDGSPVSAQARAGTHPDLHIVRKELAAVSREDQVRKRKQTNIPVEVLRQFVIEPSAMASAIAKTGAARASKVFIIDEAELMDGEGQNALLKTLEEPPPGTVLILVTSALDRLLITVRSRCQSVAFASLDANSMAAWMNRAEIGGDSRERAWYLWFADGSPGLATLAARRGLKTWHDVLEPLLSHAERGNYQPALGSELARLIDEQVAEAVKAAPESSKEAANRLWARHMLAYLARFFRDGVREPARQDSAIRALNLLTGIERAVAANVRISDSMENFSVQLAARVAALV